MARSLSWLAAILFVCLAGAPVMALWNPELSICDLPQEEGRELHIRARYSPHAHGIALKDPACPAQQISLANGSLIKDFLAKADPGGRRFGIPAGAGTYSEVELFGRLEGKRFVIQHVGAYDRFDILDPRWTIDAAGKVGASSWLVDEQFPFTNPRTIREFGNHTAVNGTLANQEVGKLLKLANADATTMCQTSESAQGLVRLQCMWQKPPPGDMRTFVFAPDGNTWRIIMKSDGVRQ